MTTIPVSGPPAGWWLTPLPDLIDEERSEFKDNPDALAARMEQWAEIAEAMEYRATAAKALRDRCRALMAECLTKGEVVVAPSGRVWFMGEVSDGAAKVRPEAYDELSERLPAHLRPEQVTKYRSVTDLRKALKSGEIDAATYAALVEEPGKRDGLQSRTLATDTEAKAA